MSTINVYHRPDAVDGVGFLIEHCARPMHSISWPDRLGERMTPGEMERLGVTCEPIGCRQCPSVPALEPMEFITDVSFGPESGEPVLESVAVIAINEPSVADLGAVRESATESAVVEEADTTAEDAAASDVETASDEATEPTDGEVMSEAQLIRKYLSENPKAANGDVIKALAEIGATVTSSQVSRERKKLQAQ